MSFAVILAAAGKSSRFGESPRKKPFLDLQGRPVWIRALEPFLGRDDVVQRLITIAPDEMEWFQEQFRANLAFLDVQVVPGGMERADSVELALKCVQNDVQFVAVHDAARPLISKTTVDTVFTTAMEHGAAIPASPVVSTLKRATSSVIEATVPRQHLWQAQTPQTARRDWLMEAFARRNGFQATDEAQLLEQAGFPVQIVAASALNMKITTQEDFHMAEALLAVLPQEKS